VLLLNECLLFLLFVSLRLSPETFGYTLVFRLVTAFSVLLAQNFAFEKYEEEGNESW
jgi:hypothetical protein